MASFKTTDRFFLGAAVGNGLTYCYDSIRNSRIGALDVDGMGSMALLYGTGVWAVEVEITGGSLALLFTTDEMQCSMLWSADVPGVMDPN